MRQGDVGKGRVFDLGGGVVRPVHLMGLRMEGMGRVRRGRCNLVIGS